MKTREAELSLLYLFFDLIILNTVIVGLAYLSPTISLRDFREMTLYLIQGNLSLLFTYFVFTKNNLYQHETYKKRIYRITKRTSVFLLFSCLIAFMLLPQHYSVAFIFEYTFLFYIGELLFYWFLYKYLRRQRQKGVKIRHAIIIGLNETALSLRNIIDSNLLLGYQFTGFVDEKHSDYPDHIGHPDNLRLLLREYHVEMVFVTMSMYSGVNRLNEYLKICNLLGVRVRFVPVVQPWNQLRNNKKTTQSLVLINPQEIPLDNLGSRLAKRLFDIAFSTAVITLVFTWLFPIIMIMIKVTSKGPVFFIQKRTGINNQIFTCIKFRSMTVNSNADTKQATVNDNRITGIGRFMRKTNIDEFPQFFNVLMGQMSVVGPRPHMLKHTEEYSELIKFYLTRHYVKPGVTGWAQVNGYRGITDEIWKMEKRVQFDMEYIEGWNLWWDVKIIMMTMVDRNIYYNAG